MTLVSSQLAPTIGVGTQQLSGLQTSNLPNNTVLPVYLVGRSISFLDTNNESCKACCISFIQHLVTETDLKLANLIEGKRIGAIHIENHKLKSLTVSSEMLEIFIKANIKGISIIQGQKVLAVVENTMIRAFASEEQYKKYTLKLI